ncbi:MAG TPA: hypothetical protein VGF55_28095 [Gemmataceae bacterium]|jgi:hypothetical protein
MDAELTAVADILRCGVCGRAVVCGLGDALRYVRDGWPTCCGEVMLLAFAAATRGPQKPAAGPAARNGGFPTRPGQPP